MNRAAGVSLVKALQLGDKLTSKEREDLVRAQRICNLSPSVEDMLAKLAKVSPLMRDWESKTGNFVKFTDLLRKLTSADSVTGEVCRNFSYQIKSI